MPYCERVMSAEVIEYSNGRETTTARKFPGTHLEESIRNSKTAMDAKRLGQSRDIPIRPDWESVKDAVMKHALGRKFEDPGLRQLLLGTGKKHLVENAPHDKYWGCGRDGKGQNRLGLLLMELREELRESESR